MGCAGVGTGAREGTCPWANSPDQEQSLTHASTLTQVPISMYRVCETPPRYAETSIQGQAAPDGSTSRFVETVIAFRRTGEAGGITEN